MGNQIMTFNVSLDRETYRIIEIEANDTLYDLAAIILQSFQFGMDHPFGFYSNVKTKYSKSTEKYELFADLENCEVDENSRGVENTIVSVVFEPKKKMLFLFDYGDQWRFTVYCKKLAEPFPNIKYPRVIGSLGIAPRQYPNYEE